MAPRLPACKPRDVQKVILRLGFVFDRQAGSHRIFVHLASGRRVTLPMHNRDLTTPTLNSVVLQLGVTRESFHALLLGGSLGRRVA